MNGSVIPVKGRIRRIPPMMTKAWMPTVADSAAAARRTKSECARWAI